jgi:hypothetical protein
MREVQAPDKPRPPGRRQMPAVPEAKVMWVLLWVITSMTYGPTRSVGSQVFHSLESCQAAADFLTSTQGSVRYEQKGFNVMASCVEDKR